MDPVLCRPGLRIGDLLDARRRPAQSCRLAHYEVMTGLASVQGYSAWIQLTKSSRLTVSSRAGFGQLDPGGITLDPADQILPADRLQQGRMDGSHVPPDHPDHLVIAIAAGHEPAFASDQLHPRASYSGCLPQRNARMLA